MPQDRPDAPPDRAVLTPSALNSLAREIVEGAFPLLWIEGELSNVSRPGSGHLYFTLKDPQAQVRCAMFRNRAMYLRFKPGDGQHVLARAKVSFYEARGEFQLIVEHLEEAGEGALRREFERLRAKLAAEGLFDAAVKRTLPRFPRRIALITSPRGAAVHDVIAVLARRYALAEIDVLPVPVQGTGAARTIETMLTRAGDSGRYDVIVLTRGGGSIEDLWEFNDESLARAVRASPVPVVAAIGHEVDITLAELAADLRAPTPSAAAELLAPSLVDIAQAVQRAEQRLLAAIDRRLRQLAQRTDGWGARLQAQRPAQRVALAKARLAALLVRLRHAAERRVAGPRGRLAQLAAELRAQHPAQRLRRASDRLGPLPARAERAMLQRLVVARRRIEALGRALNSVGPLGTLDRGYALLRQADGRVIRAASDVKPGDEVHALLAEGSLKLRVLPDESAPN
jgi:exodeoxyribonuclease VII large subunit